MNTLPAATQEHYYELVEAPSTKNAQLIMQAFFKAYSSEEAQKELWLLFSAAITSGTLPNNHLPEERKCMLHFYEFTKAMITAANIISNKT